MTHILLTYSPPGMLCKRMYSLERAPEQARIHLVDDDHGSPFKAWQAMGGPDARGSNSKPSRAKLPIASAYECQSGGRKVDSFATAKRSSRRRVRPSLATTTAG